MNFGTSNLCDVREVRYVPSHQHQPVPRYHVTWGRYISGLDVFSKKFKILYDMMVKDAKSWEVGLITNDNDIMFIKREVFLGIDSEDAFSNIMMRLRNRKSTDIIGAVFDDIEDVKLFTDRLEKAYIVHILKQ